MMKIESRSPVDLDDLPPWDDTDAPLDDLAAMPAGRRLTPYSFDSEQRTLVGIGPGPRARRSRATAEAPESQRLPPSEPPGPFIAEEEDELPASPLRRKLGQRATVVSAVLLVPLAAVGLVRGLSMHDSGETEPARAAAAPVPHEATEEPRSVSPERESAELRSPEPQRADDTEAPVPVEALPALPRSAPTAEQVTREVAPLSVSLPELPPASDVVDTSKGNVNAGIINVASTPPSKVVLDGRPLGMSPRQVRVPAGPHTLVFIHPLYGRRSLNVNVRSGATTSAAADF